MGKISFWQLAALLFVSRVHTEMMHAPGKALGYNMSLFTITVSSFITLLLFYLPVIYIACKYPNDNVMTLAYKGNKVVAWIIGVVYIFILISICTSYAVSFELYIANTMYEKEMSMAVISITMGAVLLIAFKNLEAMSRMTTVTLFFLAVFMVILTSALMKKVNTDFLYPVTIQEPPLFFRDLAIDISKNNEVLLFSMFISHVRKKSVLSIPLYILSAIGFIVFTGFLYITVLGPFADYANYEMYVLSSYADVGILQRLDSINAIVWILITIIKIALYLTAAGEVIGVLLPGKLNTKPVLKSISAVIVVIMSVYVLPETGRFTLVEMMFISCIPFVVFCVVLPLTSIISHKIKSSKGKNLTNAET